MTASDILTQLSIEDSGSRSAASEGGQPVSIHTPSVPSRGDQIKTVWQTGVNFEDNLWFLADPDIVGRHTHCDFYAFESNFNGL